MTSVKPDADQIQEFLKKLAEEDWIKRSERNWWPLFLFHYTDIRNAVEILRGGYLYSRQYLEDENIPLISSGSSRILANTDAAIKDCVRFYFRPKTPTQYHAEGIRSRNYLSNSDYPDAHCPVPIFFLFDSVNLLSRSDCEFSDGNLGTSGKATLFHSAEELANLPWKEIYHNDRILPKERPTIVFRRNAEVIIPQKLDLRDLRYIYCRSHAERETLLQLLPDKLRNKYEKKVVATARNTLFFRRHTFVESARLSSKAIRLHFSPDTESPGPFYVTIDINDRRIWENQFVDHIRGKLEIPFRQSLPKYEVRIFLDSHITYAGKHVEIDVPF